MVAVGPNCVPIFVLKYLRWAGFSIPGLPLAVGQLGGDKLYPGWRRRNGHDRPLGMEKRASLTRTITAEDVESFARLTGDKNPVHLDKDYAATTRFGRRIAHGMLVGSLFSTLFGTETPGPGALYLGQSLRFKAPVFLGDQVTATVELTHLRTDKPVATYATVATNQDGDIVADGEATLYVPNLKEAS